MTGFACKCRFFNEIYIAENFAHKAAFYLPVDIQKIMPTGDRTLIQASAKKTVDLFRERGASIIARDYGSWKDIEISEEWAGWAKETFIKYAENPV